jgi:transposase InsO family protein
LSSLEPHKRPKCSYVRFSAELPNECWQAATTHWALADGTDVEVLNIVDDHSRYLIASRAFLTTKAADVVATFEAAAAGLGLPASLLTDNGAIFTAESRGGRCAMETLLVALGVDYKHGRPYHPQTQGKVKRFHQTLKRGGSSPSVTLAITPQALSGILSGVPPRFPLVAVGSQALGSGASRLVIASWASG